MAHSGPWDPFLFVTAELTGLPKIYGMTGTITSILNESCREEIEVA